jgi:hypothetical protein
MKQFIVLLAILPLMLGLLMQVGLAQSNFALTVRAESIARDCREAAADEGGFSDALRAEAAARLADVSGVSPGELSVAADETPDSEGRLSYRFGIPIRRLTATPALFGVKKGANTGTYILEGTVHARTEEEPPATDDEIDE